MTNGKPSHELTEKAILLTCLIPINPVDSNLAYLNRFGYPLNANVKSSRNDLMMQEPQQIIISSAFSLSTILKCRQKTASWQIIELSSLKKWLSDYNSKQKLITSN